jgi:hypothetical protein
MTVAGTAIPPIVFRLFALRSEGKKKTVTGEGFSAGTVERVFPVDGLKSRENRDVIREFKQPED